eukprot:gene9560-10567_t
MKKTNAKIRKSNESTPNSTNGILANNNRKAPSSWLKDSRDGSILRNISFIIKVVLIAAVAILAYVVFKQSQAAIANLINAKPEQLKDAFFGEMPYLFYCDRGNAGGAGGSGGSIPKQVPAIFTELNQIKGSKMGFAILNCSQILPSGKTIYERFKLKKEVKPTIWGLAPWAAPRQANGHHLKDVTTLKKFVEDSFTAKAKEVKSTKQLFQFCGFMMEEKGNKNKSNKKVVKVEEEEEEELMETCLVISRGGRYGKSQAELEERIIMNHPRVKFASIDASKLRLNYENVEEVPADVFGLRLHALRNGTHWQTMVNPPTWDYLQTFLSQALAAPSADYSVLEKKQKIELLPPNGKVEKKTKKAKRGSTPPPPPPREATETPQTQQPKQDQERQASSSSSRRKESSESESKEKTTTTPAEAEEAEALAKAEQARRERLIRDQMDRMEREYLFEEGEEVEEDASASEETVEEEEMIEL